VTILVADDELDAIVDRIGAAICSPPDHPGPCANPWSIVSAPVNDLDEPERSAWLPYVEELMDPHRPERQW